MGVAGSRETTGGALPAESLGVAHDGRGAL